MTRFESSRDDLLLDGSALAEYEDGGCWLVVLDDWQLSVILSSLRYAHWLARWKNLGPYTGDELEARINQMEHCLMAGCDVDALLTKFDSLISAIQGLTLTCSPDITVEPASPTVTCSPDVTVNCGGSGGGTGGYSGGYGGWFGIDPDPDPGQPAPGDPPVSWTDPPEDYDGYKCKAANVLVLNLAEFLATCNVLVLNDYSLYPDSQSVIDFIAASLTSASNAIGSLLNSTAATIGKMLNCAASGQSCGAPAGTGEVTFGATTSFYDVRLNLLTDRSDAVCELFDAETVSAAKTAIVDRITDYLALGTYSADEQTTFLNSLDSYLSNVWLNRLFVKDSQVAGYADQSAVDCSQCGGPGLLVLVGTGATLIPPDNQWVTLTSENINNSVWRLMINDQVDEGGTGHNYIVEWRNFTSSNVIELALGIEDSTGVSVWGAYPANVADIIDPLEFNLRCGSRYQIDSGFLSQGATQFTVEVRVTEGC